jgi:hypothetical protein
MRRGSRVRGSPQYLSQYQRDIQLATKQSIETNDEYQRKFKTVQRRARAFGLRIDDTVDTVGSCAPDSCAFLLRLSGLRPDATKESVRNQTIAWVAGHPDFVTSGGLSLCNWIDAEAMYCVVELSGRGCV